MCIVFLVEDNCYLEGANVAPLISFQSSWRHGSSSKVTRTADLQNYFYMVFFVYSSWIQYWQENSITVERIEATHLWCLLKKKLKNSSIWNPGFQFSFCPFFLVDLEDVFITSLCCLFLPETETHVLRLCLRTRCDSSCIKGVKKTNLLDLS